MAIRGFPETRNIGLTRHPIFLQIQRSAANAAQLLQSGSESLASGESPGKEGRDPDWTAPFGSQ